MLDLGREPACMTSDTTLAGEFRIASGNYKNVNNGANSNKNFAEKQAFVKNKFLACEQSLTENCDSILSFFPKWFEIPSHFKNMPFAIQHARELTKKAFSKPKRMLTKLQRHQPKEEGGVGRQVRSERRNIALAIADYMVFRMDWEKHTMSDSLEKMANKIGVSLDRVESAFYLLVNAGYVTSQKRWTMKENGKICGLSSIKRIMPSFFIDLGIWKKISDLIDHKKRERIKMEKEEECKPRSNVLTNLIKMQTTGFKQAGSYLGKTFQKFKSPAPSNKPPVKPQPSLTKEQAFLASVSEDVKKEIYSRVMESYKRNPHKTLIEHQKDIVAQYSKD